MDEAQNLSETEDSQPLFVDLSGSTYGDPPRIGRYRIVHRLFPKAFRPLSRPTGEPSRQGSASSFRSRGGVPLSD